MNSRERMIKALNHQEPDRVPYDLAGTTVTGICKGAFLNAMKERGLSTEYDAHFADRYPCGRDACKTQVGYASDRRPPGNRLRKDTHQGRKRLVARRPLGLPLEAR